MNNGNDYVDYNSKLVKEIEVVLSNYLGANELSMASNSIVKILYDYDITKKNTEMIPYDDFNQRILNTYRGCLIVDGKAKSTIYQYTACLKHLFEFLGNKKCVDIGAYDVRYYLACEKNRGLSNTSLENQRANISAFFQWLTNEDYIQKNPIAKLSTIKCANIIRYPFTEIDIDAIRGACVNMKERALIEILLSSGMRVSELSNMLISDIDFNNLTVHIRNGKGGKDRITYITPLCATYIKKYLDSRKEKDVQYLFCNKNHEKLCSGGIRFILCELSKRSHVNNIHPHRFRRTFASNLAKNGMDIQHIRKLLGHSDINTTLKYVYSDNNSSRISYSTYMH